MATFAEITYMVLDLLKEHSDDAFYTEEHVIFLAKKMRALLLERKYKNSRNGTYNIVSEENKQQVCLQVEPAMMLPDGCGGQWLRSTSAIPQLLPGFDAVTCTGHDLLPTNVTFISPERMHYVGYNKWLQNIIYVSRSIDGHLYLRSNNPQFIYLTQLGLTGVFADPEEAAKMSHEACMNGGMCDIMSQPFPLEAALVPALVEMVAQELAGPRLFPEDKQNNAKDDLPSNAPVASSRVARPANNSTYRRRSQEEEEE